MSQFGGPGGGGYGGPPGGGGYGGPPGGGYGGPPAGGPPGGGGYGPPGGSDPYGNQSGMGPPMGGNPYAPPAGGYDPMGGGPDPSVARAKCGPPAIVMMVTTGIGIAFTLLGIVFNIIGAASPWSGVGGGRGAQFMSGAIGIVMGLFQLAVGAFCFFGLLKMQNAQSWGLALGAVIAGMIPCIGPCWCFNIFIGVWGIIVLSDSNVKAAFRG